MSTQIMPPEQLTLPLLPLRDVVVFPHMVIPLFVGRPKSIKALEAAMEAGKSIMLVAQKNAAKDEPTAEDIYEIGCVANILQMLKLPDGTVKVLVEGAQRARIERIEEGSSHFTADVVPIVPDLQPTAEAEALRRAIVSAVRPVREAEQEDPGRDPDFDCRHRRGRPAGGHDCRASAVEARAEAEDSRDVRTQRAARASAGAARGRDRHPAGRKAHPRPRQAADGEEPARVLPERAGQGDPEGARRRRRGCRPRGAGKEDPAPRGCRRLRAKRRSPS